MSFSIIRALSIYMTLLIVVTNTSVKADDLKSRVLYWQESAFQCTKNSFSYPSKEAAELGMCDDGDMTLFNGLLCAAGDDRGCEGVKRAQGADGRWWRSPGKIGVEAPSSDVSFSPDQSLGVFLYVVATGDRQAFDNWVAWMDRNRPCTVEFGGRCFVHGWPRFCRDDAVDKRCTLRPTSCELIKEVAATLGSAKGSFCSDVLKEYGITQSFFPSLAVEVVGSAAVNDAGFPTHLASVLVLLLQQMHKFDEATKLASAILVEREKNNPFFKVLNRENRIVVAELLLNLCPSAKRPTLSRSQWSWERTDGEEAWRRSMLWDCIFVAKLLSAS